MSDIPAATLSRATVAAALRFVPPLVPLLLLFAHGCIYNLIGEVAASRGIDHGPLLTTALDVRMPFIPVFVLPYLFVWGFPLLLIACALRERGFDPTPFHRLSLGLVALMGICYVLWIAFPVMDHLRVDEATLAGHGWLGGLVAFNYERATPWNACPSFHVAGPWLLCRVLPPLGRWPRWMFWGVTASIIASTVLIRIHYVVDIPCGIAVAELAHRIVKQRKAWT